MKHHPYPYPYPCPYPPQPVYTWVLDNYRPYSKYINRGSSLDGLQDRLRIVSLSYVLIKCSYFFVILFCCFHYSSEIISLCNEVDVQNHNIQNVLSVFRSGWGLGVSILHRLHHFRVTNGFLVLNHYFVGREKMQRAAGMPMYAPFYKAVVTGDWVSAKAFLDGHPDAITARISEIGETALHAAVAHGHVRLVEALVRMMSPEDLELKLYVSGDTALHIAARGEIMVIAKALVGRNRMLVIIPDGKGQLPVTFAALSGSKEMLAYLYSKTPSEALDPPPEPQISCRDESVPVGGRPDHGADILIKAIKNENYDFAKILLEESPRLASFDSEKGRKSLFTLAEMHLPFSSGIQLGIVKRWIHRCIHVEPTYCAHSKGDIEISQRAPDFRILPFSKIPNTCIIHLCYIGSKLITSALKFIDIGNEIYDMKKSHIQALELIRQMCPQESTCDPANNGVYLEAIFRATKCGNVDFVKEIIRSNPAFLWGLNTVYGSIFHVAVAFRQEKIWNLIYGLSAQKNKITEIIIESNNMLHMAACPVILFGPTSEAISSQRVFSWLNVSKNVPGAAMRLQSELQWYKEVERMLPSSYKDLTNRHGETPKFLFAKWHNELVTGGERWMRETATSCTIVAALVVTVMFAAAFTLPGGTDQNSGDPIYLRRNSFIVFLISDAISLFSSVTALLMFLSILTSRFAEEDFLSTLPRRLIIGLATLFLSIATMMLTFGAALVIVIGKRMTWAAAPVSLLAGIALLQFPLFVDMVSSTYGPCIFDRKTKCLFLADSYS